MATRTKEQFIEIENLNLPNQDYELFQAEEIITKLKSEISKLCNSKLISNETHEYYFEEIAKILDFVGRLSLPLFNILDDLEIMYVMKYVHSPKLGKKLWLDHYDKLHHPHSLLKNRCHKLMDDIDTAYYMKFKKYPPNWKI